MTHSDLKAVQTLVDRSNERARKGWERMQRRAKARRDLPFNPKKDVRLDTSIDPDVFWHAVATEGNEILDPGCSYWDDMKRKFDWLGDSHDKPNSPNRPNAFYDDKNGVWWKRQADGTYTAEKPPRRDWSKM